MVTAEESRMYQQFAAPNSLNLDHMAAHLQLDQNCRLPYPPPLTSNAAFFRQPNSDSHGLNAKQLNAVGGLVKPQLPYPTQKPCPAYFQRILSHGLGISDMPVDAPQKRFLIFDQSGCHTRLFFSNSFSQQNLIPASKTPLLDQKFSMKPVVEENWGENNLTDGEDEMLKDSEEIDALFYSDTDVHDEDSDTDNDNDEVTSVARILFRNEDAYSNEKSLEELAEEVASSNGMQKRRKLLNGRYKIPPSLLHAKCRVERASSRTDDVESSCAGARKSHDDLDSRKKVKVRDALKTLETIIPGLNRDCNDPLHIIEKAIVFLKSMRIEAEALGLGYLNHQSATSPQH